MTKAPQIAPKPKAYKLEDVTPQPYFVPSLSAAPEAEMAVEEAQREGMAARHFLSWGGLFWSCMSALVSLSIGLWIDRVVEDLFARSPVLGTVALTLAGLAVLAVLVMGVREWRAVLRQRQIAHLHRALAEARAADDQTAARQLVRHVTALYADRAALRSACQHVHHLTQEIVDGRDLIDITETQLMGALDGQAKREIAQAAKRVSVITAISPRAIVDLIFVLFQAIRLIRRLSEIYGGRPGLFGFVRLARSVGAHLVLTGGMVVGDSLLQQVIGHGLAAKLSARLGEGVLNGMLTTRVGLSAMAVCRPMPFGSLPSPRVAEVAPFLFRGQDKPAKSSDLGTGPEAD